MSVNRWKLVAMPVLMLGLASPMLVNCGAAGGLPGPAGDLAGAASGCDELKSGDFAKLEFKGDAKVQGRIKGFLEAAYSLQKVTVDMEAGLMASCGQLGKDLGMSDAELKAEPGGGKGAEKVCGAVAAKIKGILKANAGASLSIDMQPPKCYADIEAMQKCFADCGSPVKGGDLKASCQGGEISGKCDAECKGSCTVEAGAQCTGTCSGSCSGSCEADFSGKCGGDCEGKCDGQNAKGKCAGKCEGKCTASAEGHCGGKCSGKCSASCEVKGQAKCSGNCSGGCSAEVKEPKCSGEFKPPSVDAHCQASCAAKGAASAKCDPPSVKIVAKGKASADVEKLIAALQTSLPAIVKIQLGVAKKLGGTMEGVAKAGAELPSVAASAGGKAIACVKAGVEATAGASASVNVNVKASASVSGSASGGAGG